jgi:undecaprenyl diphosphate synthase
MATLDPARLPVHVGIIMDGNGRWAAARRRPRRDGHLEGLTAAKRVVRAASDAGLRFLSLYVFSTENWTRTEEEVSYLMFLIQAHLKKEYDFYRKNGIRIFHSGDLARLPSEIAAELRSAVRDTAAFTGLTVNLAINYGGKDEIVRACRRAAALGPLTEESIASCMDQPGLPDPDLIIRSGGDVRMSNFLLWESAYAELYFSPKLWPDWDESDLQAALQDYARRERRFGGRPRKG